MIKPQQVVERIFVVDEIAQFGIAKGEYIHNAMVGRYAGTSYDWGIMAQSIAWAGHGDHLEIGTLFGGSAILAALVKQEYGFSGNIVCIDPLDSYYGSPIDPMSGSPLNIDVVRRNIDMFGVTDRIKLIPTKSQPWPLSDQDKFVSAFIDGQHDYKACLSDWLNCKKCVERVIQFDNHDMVHPQICHVVSQATQSEWLTVHVSGISAVLAKRSWLWSDYQRLQLL